MFRHLSILTAIVAALTVSGCAKNPEVTLRERAQAYTQLLLDEHFDEAVNYYDPDIVAQKGRTSVAGGIQAVVQIVKGLTALGGRKTAGFEIRKVDFDSARTHATLQIIFLTTDSNGGDRKESPTDQKWVLKNSTWYATQ
jgi:hypothetical protein